MKHFRSCNLCEAICGLEIDHDGKKVLSIKGDKDDPLSRGHICPKATALQDIHEDPDRLRKPVKRTAGGWAEISWQQAFDEIEKHLQPLRLEHGNDAVALYLGNPTVHNLGALTFMRPFKQALDTRNVFAATSVDQLPHHFAASYMFGHGLLLPVPDIDRCNHMLILGANPAASNGSLMTAPGMTGRLKAIREKGGKIVLVDPRRTETARYADQHHFIKPGADVWLLAAMLQVIFDQGLTSGGKLNALIVNRRFLEAAVESVTPGVAARHTGVSAAVIERMAHEFAASEHAVCYGRIGLSTQAHGGMCQWLVNALNIVTGNLDRAGGAMFTTPAVSLMSRQSTLGKFNRWQSRVRGLSEFDGDLPVSVLAEEMLVEGDGKIRALITHAGNPVLSTPNGGQLEKALQGLDFMVSIDIYINETTRHAHIILPPATGLEVDHYDLVFNTLAVRNIAKFSPALFEPESGQLRDWQILKELTARLCPHKASIFGRTKRALRQGLSTFLTPKTLLALGLFLGPYGAWRSAFSPSSGITFSRLKKAVHGIDLGPLQPRLPDALRTEAKTIDIAPTVFLDRFQRLWLRSFEVEHPTEGTFRLIGRRHLRDNNSWMHNSKRLVKGNNRCTAMMNPGDAAPLGLSDGQTVRVCSRVGSIDLPLELTKDIVPGAICIPHGYGHNRRGAKLSVAGEHAGASVNDITDEMIVDELTGNAAFSGQFVQVTPMESGDGRAAGIDE